MTSTKLESKQEAQVTTARTKPLIMIIDDNVELLEELSDVLKLGGYDVVAISDCTRALDTALNNRPDLILLDMKMSPKSGFEIAEDVRNSLLLKDTPVIAMTGFYTENQHFLMMKLSGIKTSILKPFKPFNLISKIEFALGNRLEEYENDET